MSVANDALPPWCSAAGADEALRESEEKFRSVFEQAAIGMGRVSFGDARWIDANDAFCCMLGYTRQELLATPWPEITHPDDIELDLVPFRRMAAGALDSYTVEKRFIHKDGSHVWARLTLSLVRDARRQPDYEIAVIENITDRKRAEQRSWESQARLAAALASMSDAVFISDAEGRFVDFNDAFATFHRFGNKDECARTLSQWAELLDVAFPDGKPAPPEMWAVQRALRGERASEAVYRLRRKDTGEQWVGTYSFAPIRDEQGAIVGSVVVCRDITDVMRANEQLVEADRRKNEFLAVLSHELRNPLAPIRNSVAILERSPGGGENARRAREVIARQADHMTRLIDDLLDISRISRGKIVLRREPLDLSALARATAEDHRELFATSGVQLAVHTNGGDPVYIEGDRIRVAQVIGNLLNNAMKFTPRGGVTELAVEATTDGHAVARVRDTGAGMSSDTLEHVFEPFVQAEQTLERSPGGLGLGLALVKDLVEMHGGTVRARSEGVGRGSEFSLTFPLRTREKVPADVHASAPMTTARRVLLIEDNVDAAESLKDLLELDGHRVAVASSGPEGLAQARTFMPDIVLCDIGLPGMDGYEVARAFRADDQLHAIALVALTGYALAEDQKMAASAGFDRHLAKPPDLEALERVLAELPEQRAV